MKTAIVTDSNSGIFEKEAGKLGIYTVPMPVLIEDETFYEGRNLSHPDFYAILEERRQVATSQPSPEDVTDVWDRALADGYDELVYIPMSSGLSSGTQTALMLAEEYGGRVQVADNHRISVTQRHSVLDALLLRYRGMNAAEIRRELETTAYLSLVYVGVQDLYFLKRGGRVTPAAAAMGAILNLKPLLSIKGDKLDAYAKVRGTPACQAREIRAMQEYAAELKSQGYAVRISAAGSYASEKDAKAWLRMVRAAFPEDRIHYDPLTFSIACHVGPGAFGMGVSIRL